MLFHLLCLDTDDICICTRQDAGYDRLCLKPRDSYCRESLYTQEQSEDVPLDAIWKVPPV